MGLFRPEMHFLRRPRRDSDSQPPDSKSQDFTFTGVQCVLCVHFDAILFDFAPVFVVQCAVRATCAMRFNGYRLLLVYQTISCLALLLRLAAIAFLLFGRGLPPHVRVQERMVVSTQSPQIALVVRSTSGQGNYRNSLAST